MVKEIDRVGRMADTLEFKNLALPRDRFAPELLEQLLELAPSTIEIDGDNADRRPLLRRAPDDAAQPLPRDGDAGGGRATSCASTATRSASWRSPTSSPATCSGATSASTAHGRVVFYDYDEIEYLTDCVFRAIPPPPNPEAELSGEPWYPVGPLDVFPEEFETFLLGDPRCARRSCATTPTCSRPSSGRVPAAGRGAARWSTSSRIRRRCGSAARFGSG